ncbi:sigma-54 dependent transcriptional regulator/response regulator [Candidatus Velamenicoccus archaeovorus]|uniref:Sigma-54 dependent transcriptional regulator/response regulator n=1 Tax=Velamenicoccus archaeovorus TaxID=1930593 RepID=A0A410P3F2_VELA1|nr:response regulator [Candidatus Velamenicoccus archaeovorus]QAT16727.1 sigma-54 dependent transcriptional regulator/response regulator [Candidatus Velamenicoccus archaeovorus]
MKLKYGVLVVDDDETLAQDTKHCLEHYSEIDLEIDICLDSSEVISCLSRKNKCYDLILLDIKMPKLSGTEVLQLIKKGFPDIHVIIISAYLDEYSRDELIRLGAYAVFEKPCDYHKVKEYIRHAIDDIEITNIRIKGLDLRKALYQVAKELIFKALRRNDWHLEKTSKNLNITRWCLDRWMKKLYIKKTGSQEPGKV